MRGQSPVNCPDSDVKEWGQNINLCLGTNDRSALFHFLDVVNECKGNNKILIYNESLVSYIIYTGEDLISAEDVKPYKNNRNKMLEYLAFKSAKIIPLKGMGNDSLICTLFKAGGTTRDTYTSFFNVKNGNSKTIKNREKGVVNLPIFNRIEGDTLYAIVPPEDVKKMETLSILNKKSRQLIKTAPEDGKYAIAKYILSRRLSN